MRSTNEGETAHKFYTICDFAELYTLKPEETLKDLEQYFKVKLYASQCGCESSGVGVCCRTEQGPGSDVGDNKSG